MEGEIINDSLRGLTHLIQQLQICWIGDIGWRAGGIDAEGAPILSLLLISQLDQVFKRKLVIGSRSMTVCVIAV